MEEDFEFGDKVPPAVNRMGNVIGDADGRGFNPGLIVLLVVGGLLLAFLVVNYALYMYAQKTLPPQKKNQFPRRR
ncbi:DNA-binding protein S1FA2, partial [Cucurbita argyrosperma subsp. sororia]